MNDILENADNNFDKIINSGMIKNNYSDKYLNLINSRKYKKYHLK